MENSWWTRIVYFSEAWFEHSSTPFPNLYEKKKKNLQNYRSWKGPIFPNIQISNVIVRYLRSVGEMIPSTVPAYNQTVLWEIRNSDLSIKCLLQYNVWFVWVSSKDYLPGTKVILPFSVQKYSETLLDESKYTWHLVTMNKQLLYLWIFYIRY